MTHRKAQRNARIVRLRDNSYDLKLDGPVSFAWIAKKVSREFPDDPISKSGAYFVYRRDTK